MSRYKSEDVVYNPMKKKYVPLWRLDTNTAIVIHFNADTLTDESKTYHIDFIRYHLHFSDSHCPDRLRKLVNEGKIEQYLDDLEQRVGDAIDGRLSFGNNSIRSIKLLSSHAMFKSKRKINPRLPNN